MSRAVAPAPPPRQETPQDRALAETAGEFSYQRIVGRGFNTYENEQYEVGQRLKPSPRSRQLRTAHMTLTRKGDFDHPDRTNGWKFHIAVEDESSLNMARTWNILAPIMMRHNLCLMKILINPINDRACEDARECGRQITIYAHLDRDNANWHVILQEIENALGENDVMPALRQSPVFERMQGSLYISRRNDMTESGGYLPATRSQTYNDGGYPDPFCDIMLSRQSTHVPQPQ